MTTSAVQERTPVSLRPMHRALVVVGMHRSGTSAMTRMLSLLGARVPNQLLEANESNPTGHWEPQSIVGLNDEILETLDSEWDDVFSFRPRHYLSNFDRVYAGRAVELLGQAFDGSELVVLKDPRISVLTSFWDRALQEAGYAPHYVVMVRNPLEIAESLRARDGFPREKSLLLWSSYMIAAERDTRGRNRTFVSYDQLLSDWRAVRGRIEESTGVPFPRNTATASNEIDRFLDPRLHHHHAPREQLFSSSDVPDDVKTLYRIFSAACDIGVVDFAAIDDVQIGLAKVESVVGPLMADLKGRSRSLAREVGALQEAHAGARERADHLSQELDAERTLRQSDAQSMSESRSGYERQLSELVSRLAIAEAERDRLGTEILMKERELDAARAALAERAAAAETRLNERFGEIAALTRELQQELAKAAKVRETAAEKESELSAEVGRARAEKESVESRLKDRFGEIAALSSLLAESEEMERRSTAEADWLREVGSILLNDSGTWKGRWFRFLPAIFHFRRQQRLLKRKGLFDAEAYLAANFDVAERGSDPLRHYLKHGIKEQRKRG